MKLQINSEALESALATLKGPESKLGTVLIIDDEQANLDGLRRFLEREYKVLATTDPEVALDHIRNDSIDLVLSDQRMPKRLGTEVLADIMKINPDNIRMILTGYTDINDLITCINSGLIYRYVVKPWNSDELKAVIGEAMKKLKLERTISRLVPRQVWNRLYAGALEEAAPGEGKEIDCATLFLDVRGFTSLVETMTPTEAFSFLTSYMGCLSPIIENHHGYIDKYLGDGLMAIFDREGNYHSDAVNCAVDLIKTTRDYNEKHRSGPVPGFRKGGDLRLPIDVGIGVNAGAVMLGTVGFARRLEFTALGDSVNTASRLEGLTKNFGSDIIVHGSLMNEIDGTVSGRLLGQIDIRGKRETVQVWEIFEADPSSVKDLKNSHKEEFERAVKSFCSGNPDARGQFELIVEKNPDDRAARYYLDLLPA